MSSSYLKIPTNNKVEECRVLGGIDTLYFFIDTVRSTTLYQNIWSSVLNEQFIRENYSFLNYSGKTSGFVGAWFSYRRDTVPLFRVGFKDPSKQKNVLNVQVQLYASGIYYLGFFDLLNFVKFELSSLLQIDLDYSDFISSRLDLNAFVDGYDFSTIDPKMFRSRFTVSDVRNTSQMLYDLDDCSLYSKHSRLQTLYLGSRSSPLYFKIYDKRLEMISRYDQGGDLAFQATIKDAFFREHGLMSDHLWNVEFSIKRESLKQFGMFTVQDIFTFGNSVFKQLATSCSFLGYDLDAIENAKKNNHVSRLPLHPIWRKIIDDYDFFSGGVDAVRIYQTYKDITKEKSVLLIAKQIKRQIDLNQGFSQREFNNIFYNYKNILADEKDA